MFLCCAVDLLSGGVAQVYFVGLGVLWYVSVACLVVGVGSA